MLIGTVAVAAIIISGVRLVANAGSEDETGKIKKHMMYAVMGLIVVAISEMFVKDIIFKDYGQTLGVDSAKRLIVQFTNFASGFITTVSVLSFFYAGYLYIFTSLEEGNMEKAKKIILGAIIGILIAAGAFAIVNTVIKLEPLAETVVLGLE